MHRSTLPLLSFLFFVGCGNAEDARGTSRSAIKNGTLDTETNAVLAVGHNIDGGMMCTGSLLTPDLVLTAWHCVSDMASVGSQPICSGPDATQRPAAHPASKIFVFDGADAYGPGTPYGVAEVLGPPATNLCGADVAVLRLSKPLLDRAPIAPRLDAPPVVGEVVKTIGYGEREPLDAMSSGLRAFKDTTVDHVGEERIGDRVRATEAELSVAEGPCAGDSGSPLIDTTGRTIGVMSRGTQRTCQHMIYGRVDAHADWLKELGRASAERLGQAVPEWVEPKVVAPEDAGADVAPEPPRPTTESSGCATSSVPTSNAFGALIFALVAAIRSRRCR